MSLTEKQSAFIREYLVDLNATQAAIRAGYSEKTAGFIGHENLQKPKIKRMVDAAIQQRAERTQIRADDVIRRLWEEATDKVDGTASSRVSALSWLGKHLAMFTDNRAAEFGGEPARVREVVVRKHGRGGNGAGGAVPANRLRGNGR